MARIDKRDLCHHGLNSCGVLPLLRSFNSNLDYFVSILKRQLDGRGHLPMATSISFVGGMAKV